MPRVQWDESGVGLFGDPELCLSLTVAGVGLLLVWVTLRMETLIPMRNGKIREVLVGQQGGMVDQKVGDFLRRSRGEK